MRVAVVSTYYSPEPSGNAPFSTGVAEGLVERGHEVTVLTTYPHYPAWRVTQQRLLVPKRSEVNGVNVIRRPCFVPRQPSVRKRLAYEASLLLSGVASIPRQFSPDAVLAFCPSLSDLLVGVRWSRQEGAAFVVVFQDLLSRGLSETGLAGNRVASAVRRLESFAVREANRVGVVSEGMKPYVGSLGAPSVARMRNWGRFHPSDRSADEIRAARGWAVNEVICLHAGNAGRKQGLEAILHAAACAPEPLRFVFIGNGADRRALEEEAQRRKLTRVSFEAAESDEEYSDALRAADVLLLCQRSTVTTMSMPSKLASYVMTDRPIVVAAAGDSEVARETLSVPGVFRCDPDDPAELVRVIALARESSGGHVRAGAVVSECIDAYDELLQSAAAETGGVGSEATAATA